MQVPQIELKQLSVRVPPEAAASRAASIHRSHACPTLLSEAFNPLKLQIARIADVVQQAQSEKQRNNNNRKDCIRGVPLGCVIP